MQFIGALSCVPLEALLCSPAPSSFFCGPHGSKSGHFTQSEELISKNRRYFALSSPNPPSKSTNHPLTIQSTLGTANSLVRPPHSATSHARMALTFLRRAVSGSKEKTAPKEAWVYAHSLHTDISSPIHGIDYGG